jgi:catechol 2,3-dioxygenase-like lactoylglutathione lyase family enzyme
MNAHVSSILLGVRDMDRSKRFCTEGLGWKGQRDYGISVFFEPNGGSLVRFPARREGRWRERLDRASGGRSPTPSPTPWRRWAWAISTPLHAREALARNPGASRRS